MVAKIVFTMTTNSCPSSTPLLLQSDWLNSFDAQPLGNSFHNILLETRPVIPVKLTWDYAMTNILRFNMLEGTFLSKPYAMVPLNSTLGSSTIKQWLMKLTVINGCATTPTLVAMDSGTVSMELMKWIVIHHRWRSCPRHHHLCWSLQMNRTICLPMSRADDGIVDCVGATDEPRLCRRHDQHGHADHFYCENDTWDVPCMELFQLCDGRRDCRNGEDEIFCRERNDSLPNSVCYILSMADRSQDENTFCERFSFHNKQHIVYFSLDQLSKTAQQQQQQQQQLLDDPFLTTDHEPRPYSAPCHRGLALRVWSDQHNNLSSTNTTTTTCLCPSSLYGPRCQYQNQRVTLTLQFRALSDSWQTLFAILVLLVDHTHPHQSIIESSQQLTYLPMRDCQTKFNLYLLYATRPKHSNNNNYSVEIYCQCDRGWSGRSCSVSIDCRCSLDSLCMGVDATNRSICVCPMTKLGDRCLIRNEICDQDRCAHGGQCVPIDEYLLGGGGGGGRSRDVTCICRRGYTGDRCERKEVKMLISFHSNLVLPQSLLVHFIRYHSNHPHENAATFKAIPVNQDSITLFWPQPFHLVFLELVRHDYYLAFLRPSPSPLNSSTSTSTGDVLTKTVSTSDRCPHIDELFNETILRYHLLRRIKYYHLLCQHRTGSEDLKCFVDEIHLCVCQEFGEERLANCLEFDHEKKLDCLGQNGCENDAQCFQDNPTCPQTSMCICPTCFYGRRCQFSMNGFGLSLDAILAYHIRPHLPIQDQSHLIQISVITTSIITGVGLINGFLACCAKKQVNTSMKWFLVGTDLLPMANRWNKDLCHGHWIELTVSKLRSLLNSALCETLSQTKRHQPTELIV